MNMTSEWRRNFCSEKHFQVHNVDGLVQERRNSIINALELRLSFY